MNFLSGRFGLIPDIVTYFERMAGDINADQPKLHIQMARISNIKLKTGYEAVALYHVQSPPLACFANPSSTTLVHTDCSRL
jgi:hypothetical protein